MMNRKNGHPKNAVIIPTGISITAICMAIRSQKIKSIAPNNEEKIIPERLFPPEIMRTICGTMRPMKPIIPA